MNDYLKIVNRVRKLLRLARSSSSEHEADLARQEACSLIATFQIHPEELDLDGEGMWVEVGVQDEMYPGEALLALLAGRLVGLGWEGARVRGGRMEVKRGALPRFRWLQTELRRRAGLAWEAAGQGDRERWLGAFLEEASRAVASRVRDAVGVDDPAPDEPGDLNEVDEEPDVSDEDEEPDAPDEVEQPEPASLGRARQAGDWAGRRVSLDLPSTPATPLTLA